MERTRYRIEAGRNGLLAIADPNGSWEYHADAQATIAALQDAWDGWVRLREHYYQLWMRATDERDEMRKERDEFESLLTQRTAERDTARRRVDELEAREVDVVMLREDLEQRTAELDAAQRERDEAAKDRDDWITSWRALQRHNERIEAELERVRDQFADLRKMVAALPKVEGEINERFCTGSYYSSPRDYRTHVTFEAALVALLKHRQGMEG